MKPQPNGFTLIELLVVVLIIGILSAVALPQYQKAVEKSRLTEALINTKTIKEGFNMYLLENGRPTDTSNHVCFKDMGSTVELSGGSWDEEHPCNYLTKHFEYYAPICGYSSCTVEISPHNFSYTLVLDDRYGDACFTQETDMGRYICKSLESQGWQYGDREF